MRLREVEFPVILRQLRFPVEIRDAEKDLLAQPRDVRSCVSSLIRQEDVGQNIPPKERVEAIARLVGNHLS